MPNDLRKISFFLMTKSNLTSEVLVNANITWVSMKVGYRWKEMPENYTGRKLQLHVSLERLRKKIYRALRPVGEEKNLTRPVRRKQIHIFFWP